MKTIGFLVKFFQQIPWQLFSSKPQSLETSTSTPKAHCLCQLAPILTPHIAMPGPRAPPRSDTQKVSDCLRYITGQGGFHSFGQFLSSLLDNDHHGDQVIIQTVSHFLDASFLEPFLEKLAAHRLMGGRDCMQGVVPEYGFHPNNPEQEGMCTFWIVPIAILICFGRDNCPTSQPGNSATLGN